jgi:hypothetical protein
VTTISPDARRIWRAVRGPAAIALLIVGVSIVLVLARGGGDGAALDPGDAGPSGSRALAHLLTAQGVHINVVHTAADAERAAHGATVFVTRPELVLPQRLRVLADRAGDLVLVGAQQDTVDAVAPGTRAAGTTDVAEREPGCALDDAASAATMGGVRYRSTETTCYDGTLVHTDRVTLFGAGTPMTNDRLDEQGNAALTMRLLGRHARLVWFLPSTSDPALRPSERPLTELLPAGARFGVLQLAIAVVLLALWRARRLGPVVTEPLPVVVRAAETVEGRARLYRRAGAADHAGEALRQAARARIATRLGLPTTTRPHDLVAEVARRTARQDMDVTTLLYGPPAAGDTALVQLADALDALENEVGRP